MDIILDAQLADDGGDTLPGDGTRRNRAAQALDHAANPAACLCVRVCSAWREITSASAPRTRAVYILRAGRARRASARREQLAARRLDVRAAHPDLARSKQIEETTALARADELGLALDHDAAHTARWDCTPLTRCRAFRLSV